MTFLINTFCALLICCSALVVMSANPIYSVLFLILAFVNGAALTLIAGHDYMATLFVVLYVGAMCTFFLFAIMILDIKSETYAQTGLNSNTFLTPGVFIILISAACLLNTSFGSQLNGPLTNYISVQDYTGFSSHVSYLELNSLVDTTTQIYNLGSVLYTCFAIHLIGASLILLSAMLGSIALTLNRTDHAKTQHVYTQNLRDYKKSVAKYS